MVRKALTFYIELTEVHAAEPGGVSAWLRARGRDAQSSKVMATSGAWMKCP
jgi:hypothetical protein